MQISSEKAFSCSYVHLCPEEQIGLHQQSTWELSYIIKGCGMRLIGGISEPFASGEVILIPPGIPHCWYFNEKETDSRGKITNISLEINNELLDNCGKCFGQLAQVFETIKHIQQPISFIKTKKKLLGKYLSQMSDSNQADQVPLFLQIMLLIADGNNENSIKTNPVIRKENIRLEQVKTYIICNAQRNIRLDDIAMHLGMNRASFCVFFKQTTGMTFINYLNDYRIRLACELLRKRENTISEICFQVGFNDIPYFNRVFKRTMGCSPHEYQNTISS